MLLLCYHISVSIYIRTLGWGWFARRALETFVVVGAHWIPMHFWYIHVYYCVYGIFDTLLDLFMALFVSHHFLSCLWPMDADLQTKA